MFRGLEGTHACSVEAGMLAGAAANAEGGRPVDQ